MREGSQKAVSMATDRADSKYANYGGQRIADMSENERMGIDMARANAGRGDADFQSARDALGSVGSFTDEGVSERYMNPYMNEVVTPGLRRKNEAFEAERAARKAKRGMQSAFGGRGQMWDNKFESDFSRDQDEYMGEAYGQAYSEAQKLHGMEQDRSINQAGAYSDLATSQADQSRNDIRDLMMTGLTERTRDQSDLDFKYLEHIEERDWDVNNLNTLVDTLAKVPHETTSQTDSETTQETKKSPLKTIAGVAAITAAAIATGGTSLAATSLWTSVASAGAKAATEG